MPVVTLIAAGGWLLPAAQDADEGDVGDAGEGVLKSPASGVLAGLLVGVVAWWSGW
jgi:hypothetical protein